MFKSPYIDPMFRYQMERQSFPQTIQTLQPQVQFFSVNASSDIPNGYVAPGITCVGMNVSGKEIYTKQMNNDGNIESKTYILSGGVQEQSELKAISTALEEIKEYIKGGRNESNVTTIGSTVNVRNVSGESSSRCVQQNDGWQESPRTV